MTIRPLQGQCVSCGRLSPWPHVFVCPYCTEEILMPRAWVVLRRVWFGVFTFAIGMVVLLSLMNSMSVRSYGVVSLQSWILLSIASILFLVPHNTLDVIVCSQRELRAWQLKSFMGSILVEGSAFICTSQVAVAMLDWRVAFCCGITLICLLVSPWFFRLSTWRIWVGIVLIFVSRM